MSIATIGAMVIGQYEEAVGVMVLYRLGEFLQESAIERSRNSMRALLDPRPALARVGTVVFDKTGTLTEGSFEVLAVEPAEGRRGDEPIDLAARTESRSSHPLAKVLLAGKAGAAAILAVLNATRALRTGRAPASSSLPS